MRRSGLFVGDLLAFAGGLMAFWGCLLAFWGCLLAFLGSNVEIRPGKVETRPGNFGAWRGIAAAVDVGRRRGISGFGTFCGFADSAVSLGSFRKNSF